MISYRNGAYEIVVNLGRDDTGKRRRISRSVPGPYRKRTPQHVLDAEAELRTLVADKLRDKVAEGSYGHPKVTVGELLDRWFKQASRSLEPTTVVGYERAIRLYLKPAIGSVRVDKLSAARLDTLYGELEDDRGLKPATIRHAHAVIRQAIALAVRYKWVDHNAAIDATAPSVKRPDTRTPTPDEVEKLIAGADDDLADLIALTAGLGLRRGEACALRWTDLHPTHVLVERAAIELSHAVTVKSTKSGKARQAPLGPGLSARLKARRVRMAERALRFGVSLSEASYVLSDEVDGSLPLHPNLASDRFRRHARKEAIPVRLHDLRHAKATYALASGVPAPDVARAMGWSSTKMLFDTYGHHTAVHDEALAAVNDF